MGPGSDHDHTNGGPTSPSSSPPPPPRSGEPSLFQIDDQDQHEEDGRGVLPWEPLAPRLLEEAQRLAKEGKDRPFTAAVVLAAALPFSGPAVFFGAPVLAGDAALQWGAGTPMGRTVGHGTKNAVEVREVTLTVRIGIRPVIAWVRGAEADFSGVNPTLWCIHSERPAQVWQLCCVRWPFL